MSILRKRSAANKVYIPSTARENQYLIAEFELSDSVISHVLSGQPNHDIARFYHHFSDTFFTLLNQSQLKNALVIANDKLPRVRYNTEMHQWQTNQQILFFYNPEYHELQKSFFDEQYRAKKISMLFLVAFLVFICMIMDPFGALVLVTSTVAPLAYNSGITPIHFWMTCLVAFELGYLSPPVSLNHLLTRQVVGAQEIELASQEGGDSFYYKHERFILPLLVMSTTLMLVAFGPLIIGYS